MNILNVPRQPFVGIALAAVVGIACADFAPRPSFALLVGLLIAAALFLIWARSILIYGFVAVAFFWIHSFHLSDSPGLRLDARLGNDPRAANISGSVVSEPKIRPSGFATFLFKINTIDRDETSEPVHATVFVRWRGRPQFGDELKLFGVLEPIQSPRNPGEFDWRSYLARQDVRRSLFVRYEEHAVVVRRGGGNAILRAAQRARVWMQNALSRGLGEDPNVQSVIGGVALGVVQENPSDIEEPFQKTGTFHLFAVSGLNVAIVARLLWVLGALLRVPRSWTIAFIVPGLGFYAAVTGLQASSVRAAVMTSVVLLGFFAERKVLTLNSLAAAAFMILGWNTNDLFSVGFQLSFAVVVAILLFSEPIFRILRRWTTADPFLPRGLFFGPIRWLDIGMEWFCRGAAVSLAAWLGSTPLILWNFHLLTPVSLLANLVVVPIAFFILAIALVSLLTAPLPWLAMIFNHANWLLAHLLLWVVNLFAQIPGGHFYLEFPPWPRAQTEINVLDLGVGAAVHLRVHGKDWLLDCGPERDYERLVRQYLRARGINRLDGLLLTHGDSFHIGAATEVMHEFNPRTIIDNPLADRSTTHRRIRAALDHSTARLIRPTAGEIIHVTDEVSLKILFPPAGLNASQTDDETFVVQILVASLPIKVLLVSDAGYEIEQRLLRRGYDLHSEILIKGQHHSGNSGSEALLAAVRPQLIIATSRDFPAHQRINDEWAALVRDKGIKLFRQDETGAVEIRFNPDNWKARSYLTGEVFRSSRR